MGRDRTDRFLEGAFHAMRKVRDHHVGIALFKAGSPSCASLRIHAGCFDGSMRDGPGVTAALLMSNGVRVYPETRKGEMIAEEFSV
jgi:uncharacterized protein YbbK (DUF523 family)